MAGTARIRGEYPVGCSKRLSSKAAASEEARRTLRYVEPLSEARTPLVAFFSILLTGITLALSACALGPELDLTIHESEHGAVYLERISDRSFQAAHPIALSADTMAQILRGVVVKENRGFLQDLVAGKPAAVRAIGDEDVEYLAPLLVEGLTKAASDQQVGFRVVHTGAPAESTKGSLYAYGRSLYLTLPGLIAVSRLGQGPTRSTTIHFIPESAKRPDSYRDSRSTDATLVIDYELLARLPAAQDTAVRPVPQPAAARTTGTTAEPLKESTPAIEQKTQRDVELESLRKDVQDIKRLLAEQTANRSPSKKKPLPKPKPESTR